MGMGMEGMMNGPMGNGMGGGYGTSTEMFVILDQCIIMFILQVSITQNFLIITDFKFATNSFDLTLINVFTIKCWPNRWIMVVSYKLTIDIYY